MKKILVPTDFSAAACNATAYACSLASAIDAEVCLVHVYSEPVPPMETGSAAVILAQEIREMKSARLLEEEKICRAITKAPVTSRLVTGFKSDAIKDIAEEQKANLVVMGRKITADKLIFGSTLLRFIRKSDLPVLVVPDGVRFKPIRRMMLAVDFKETVYTSSFELLFDLVKKFDADLSVLHIEQEEEELGPNEVSSKLQLGRVLGRVSYHYEKMANVNVKKGILEFIDRFPTDLVVMIAHRHNLLERVFGDLHTSSITLDISLPLLVVKNND